MNKIEEYKSEKDGLDILADVPGYAAEGWEAITEGDRERLKWAGVFFRKQTPAVSDARPHPQCNASAMQKSSDVYLTYRKPAQSKVAVVTERKVMRAADADA